MMNRSKGARRVGRRGVKIEKEEKEGIHYGIILWQCVKKEGGRKGRKHREDENRIRPLTLIPRRGSPPL